VVQNVLEKVPEAPVDVFIVWIPAISGDDYEEAMKSTSVVPDLRARHYWDGSQALGEAFSSVLGLRARMAWDVYLLFDSGAHWNGTVPPTPRRWLHQRPEEDPALELSELQLENGLRELLK
jgi:hypothetical protein